MKVMKKQYIAPLMETDYMDVAEDIIAVSLPVDGNVELQEGEILAPEEGLMWEDSDF